jgi:energy-coupling factor transport system ATP-binding protein
LTSSPDPVKLENLRLRYPETGRVVLSGVDLTVRRGEVKLLLGPSGAGKSSLALTLNGLIPHQMEGEIRGSAKINGVETVATTVAALTAQVGLLFQDPEAQIATLKVADEVAFGMENLNAPPPDMPLRVVEALRRVDMAGMEDHGTDALSGGKKQRLALASTLAMGASILVFDEPTANLDPTGTLSFFRLLSRLKSEGATILMIEHKLDDLIAEVDSIAVMDFDGNIAADGPPRQVLQEQQSLLETLGVWVPQVTELANALAPCGIVLQPYPLTVDEAVALIGSQVSDAGNQTQMVGQNQESTAAASIESSSSNAQPAIEIAGLNYTYPGGSTALSDASLTIARGDFCAIVGPNGSGKSTLARHLIGLIKPQAGAVRIMGTDVQSLKSSELNRLVGYVFQNPEHQFVALTVFDELAFSLRARKLPEREVASNVEVLLEEFGLTDYRRINPFKLSQGQKRRLSVATMLSLDPQILILDEPTFGQDLRNAVRIMESLRSLNERGITIVVITHDMKLVAEYAHSVRVLVGGRTVYQGGVRDLFVDNALLEAAHLLAPPLFELSEQIRLTHPNFPLLMTVSEYKEELCARFGTTQAAAFSTS